MPAVPQILKDVLLTLDGEDFSMDVIDAKVVPAPGDEQKVTTLDGVVHQDVGPAAWALEVTSVVDWDSVRPGLARWCFDNAGTTVAFVFKDTTAAKSTGKPSIEGDLVVVPIGYGGDGNAFATATAKFPIVGTPTIDSTP